MLLGRPLSLPEDSGNALQVLSEPLPAKIQGSLQVLPKPVCLPLCQSEPAHGRGVTWRTKKSTSPKPGPQQPGSHILHQWVLP